MAREGLDMGRIPAQADESIMTTLRVIMDVLKSHDGSIKQLQKWLDTDNESTKSTCLQKQEMPSLNKSNVLSGRSFDDLPVHDGSKEDNITDDRSEISSLISSWTEHQELPTRSTINGSSMMPSAIANDNLHPKLNGESVGGMFSTPIKTSFLKDFPDKPSLSDKVKFDSKVSSIIDGDDTLGRKIVQTAWKADKPILNSNSPMKTSLHGNMETSSSIGNSVVGLLQAKLNVLENQVSEWGEIMDEMSNRMAKQPSLIRKLAKESSSDKVPQSQYVEDMELLEKRLEGKMDDKLSSFDRKIIELHDDLTNRLNAKPSSRVERQYAKQETAVQLSIEMETLSEQFEDQVSKIRLIEKDLSSLGDVIQILKRDVNLCRNQLSSKRSDSDLVSLVAEQLLEKDEITGWRTALKEMHSALNKQSEINTSLHHSYALLDKKMAFMGPTFPLLGRWRWGGLSSVYPKSHSCTNGHHAQDINFDSQVINTDIRTFVWEKNKPYIVVTTAGCYWVRIGAFASKSSTPPSLQITVDEEPVALFNSSGKSPTSFKISVTASAPKKQSTPPKHRSEILQYRPGSSLSGAIMIPGHSRLGIWAASTVSGTRLAVEGYLEIQKVY